MPRPSGTVGWSGGSHGLCPATSLVLVSHYLCRILSSTVLPEGMRKAQRPEDPRRGRRHSQRASTGTEGCGCWMGEGCIGLASQKHHGPTPGDGKAVVESVCVLVSQRGLCSREVLLEGLRIPRACLLGSELGCHHQTLVLSSAGAAWTTRNNPGSVPHAGLPLCEKEARLESYRHTTEGK